MAVKWMDRGGPGLLPALALERDWTHDQPSAADRHGR